MKYKDLAKKIIELKNADLKMRDQLIQSGKLGKGYNKAMEALHNKNAAELDEIIEAIGYPTADKVGQEANEAAWLILQHAIGQPEFMRKCARLLESLVAEQRANPIHLAYLTDRIAVFEGKPQRYGTSFDWDENGELQPCPIDDLSQVNQRRKSLGLNQLEEQIVIMRRRAEEENQIPPSDFKRRKETMEGWRKRVGWKED